MPPIALRGIVKEFGATVAVNGVSLDIADGELFFLLGPSGCGKTTLLRMIAGFIEPTAGSLHFGPRDVTNLPPSKRNAGMVFQSYALWPHMTVGENVAYGLKVRRVAAQERRDRVMRVLETVQMAPYVDRRPTQLSGGQQQRVALARALVVEPTVLLLDEPLSNLDAKLRLEMRSEIRRICNEAGITGIYVTHDQKEALAMADRVAVLRDGVVVQMGPPRAIYEHPKSAFVAEFLGETNFLAGRVRDAGETAILETGAGVLKSRGGRPELHEGDAVLCSVRPEAMRLHREPPPANGANDLQGVRRQSVYLGEVAQHLVEVGGGHVLKVLEIDPQPFGPTGETVHLTVDPGQVVLVPSRASND